MSRYTEDALPQGFKVRVVHLHRGNSSNNQRSGHEMVTLAEVRSQSTGEVITSAKARCSDKDNPRRQIGRQVAVGRAIRAFDEHFTALCAD